MSCRPSLAIGLTLALLGGSSALAQTATTATQLVDPSILGMSVDKFEDMDVFGTDGKEIGEIDEVVRKGGSLYAIVEVDDGWFNLNEDEVAVPLDSFRMEDGRLTLPITEAQAKALGKYVEKDYEDVSDGDYATLGDAIRTR